MGDVGVVLAMLLAVVASGYLVRLLPVALPLPLVQIGLGAAIASLGWHPVRLDPHTFFILFLPPLLFLDGWRIPKVGLFRDKGVILELALGLVLFTVAGAGFLIHWLIPNCRWRCHSPWPPSWPRPTRWRSARSRRGCRSRRA